MDLNYITGVNLGNWLVLEKWMNPALFDGTTADDEYYLPTQLDPAVYEARIRTHRAEYINERDFATIASWGLNSVRIPVPYFIFGDRAPFIGCIDELDKAFNWAEKYGLTILIDLHTAPMSQNGFDNGGISGVCKWAQLPDEVEFVLSVLERLSKRYGHRRALMGIEIINEPNTTTLQGGRAGTRRRHRPDRIRLSQVFQQLRLPPSTRRRQGRAADRQSRGVPRRFRHRTVERLHARPRRQARARV